MFRDILVILDVSFFFSHSSNFRGILIILVISEVFWSFLRFWNYFDVLGVFLLDLGYCW